MNGHFADILCVLMVIFIHTRLTGRLHLSVLFMRTELKKICSKYWQPAILFVKSKSEENVQLIACSIQHMKHLRYDYIVNEEHQYILVSMSAHVILTIDYVGAT